MSRRSHELALCTSEPSVPTIPTLPTTIATAVRTIRTNATAVRTVRQHRSYVKWYCTTCTLPFLCSLPRRRLFTRTIFPMYVGRRSTVRQIAWTRGVTSPTILQQQKHDYTEGEADCCAAVSPSSTAAAQRDTTGGHDRGGQEANSIQRGTPGRKRGTTRVIMCVFVCMVCA